LHDGSVVCDALFTSKQKSFEEAVKATNDFRRRLANTTPGDLDCEGLEREVMELKMVEAEGFLAQLGVAKLSASTLHRVPRAIAARFEQNREQITDEVRESDPIPARVVTIQVGIDGVMVPQDGEHAKSRGRAWHKAAVGTLAFYDEEGSRLRTIYTARMPESGRVR
jgi:hypothetical protein